MKFITCLLLTLFSMMTWAKAAVAVYPSLTNRAEVSVLTVGTGAELYTLFGHTALRIYDPLLRIDRVYNYGLFDFRTPNFYGKFVKGDLLYYGDYEDYRDFVMGYAAEDRPVYEQHIALDDNQKQQLWQLANQSLEPENRAYIYKFVHQNCTTKVVDLLNQVLPSPIQVTTSPSEETYRSILNQSLAGHYFEKLGINLLFSSQLDQKPTLLFLPDRLLKGLEVTAIDGVPLVDKTTTLYERQSQVIGDWWNSYTFFSILVLILAFLMRYHWLRISYFVLIGLLGCLLLGISFYSSHLELTNNDTPLLCNPLLLVLPWLATSKEWSKTTRVIYILLGVSIGLFVLLNITSQKLLLVLPLVLLTSWTVFLQLNVEKRKV